MLSAGCDSAAVPEQTSPPPSPSSSRSAPGRAPDLVRIEAVGAVRDRLVTAIEDLKTVGMWRELTGHLYRVELDSRRGVANVPEDGHLADAYFTGIVEDGRGGAVCDVMFFSSAIVADLARWRDYYSRGLLPDPAPSLREFYGALLAHELAHCRRGGWGKDGEDVAQAWERRALEALREEDVSQ